MVISNRVEAILFRNPRLRTCHKCTENKNGYVSYSSGRLTAVSLLGQISSAIITMAETNETLFLFLDTLGVK